MSRKSRKSIILAKVEVTAGTDAAPIGANAMLISDLDVVPLQGSTVERGHVKPYFGARPKLTVGVHVAITFSMEIAGAGVAGDVPAYSALLRSCKMVEVDGLSDVTYTVDTDQEVSSTLHYFRDGQRHAATECKGSVAFDFSANDYPRFRFTFIGRYVAPSAVADPTPDFTAFTDPVECNSANTTFALHGVSPALQSLSIDLRNTVVYRELIGAVGVEITDRDAGGTVTFDEPALATKDFFATAKAGTKGALQVVHGTVAGNIVQLDAAGSDGGAQIMNPRFGDSDGISQLSMDLSLLPSSAGNDDLVLTVS